MEVLKRHIEEFFDLEVDVRHLPDGARSLSKDMVDNLEIRGAERVAEGFFRSLSSIPRFYGIALLINRCEKKHYPGRSMDVFYYHFLDINIVLEDRLIRDQLKGIEDILKQGRQICRIEGHYVPTEEGKLEERAARSIRDIFTSKPMTYEFLGQKCELPRLEQMPPTWYVMAILTQNEVYPHLNLS